MEIATFIVIHWQRTSNSLSITIHLSFELTISHPLLYMFDVRCLYSWLLSSSSVCVSVLCSDVIALVFVSKWAACEWLDAALMMTTNDTIYAIYILPNICGWNSVAIDVFYWNNHFLIVYLTAFIEFALNYSNCPNVSFGYHRKCV